MSLEEEIKFLDKIIQDNPYNIDAYYNRGLSYAQLNNFEEAIKNYNEVIRRNSNDAEAYNSRGASYAELNKIEEALKDYNEAIRIKPDYAEAYYNRANLYAHLGKNDEALKDYNEAIRIKPDYAEAYNNRGAIKSTRGDNKGALEDYKLAIRHAPNHAETFFNLGVFYDKEKDYNASFEEFSCSFQKTIQNNRENINPDFFLYQYRDINKNICDSLKSNSLWLASPKTFNDPDDGTFLHKAFNNSKGLTQALDNIGVISFQGKNAATGGLMSPMWAYYANNHKGMCLVFQRTQKVDSNMLKQVEYNQDRSFIMKNVEKNFHQVFCLKSEDWSHEKEWRIIAYEEELGKGKLLTYEALGIELKAIIFGFYCNGSEQSRIKSLMTEIQPGISFYKIENDISGYGFRKKLL